MIREATGMDLSKLAELYEEFHLNNCRLKPDFYRPPPEDSYYFNNLSERLLYGDEEIVVSEDEESGIINGFCVFEIYEPDDVLRRKADFCKINLLVIRRGFSGKGIDSGIVDFVRNYAAENNCGAVEYSPWVGSDEEAICDNNGFEPRKAEMIIRLK